MAQKKHWNDLSAVSRWRIAVLGIAQLALQFVALRDIVKRPAEGVNGSRESGPPPRSSTSSDRFPILFSVEAAPKSRTKPMKPAH